MDAKKQKFHIIWNINNYRIISVRFDYNSIIGNLHFGTLSLDIYTMKILYNINKLFECMELQ